MRKVKIIGGAMTKFGKHLDRNLKSLVAEAVNGALDGAGIEKLSARVFEVVFSVRYR